MISFVVGALCTVTRELVERLEDLETRGQAETTQTWALLRSARLLRVCVMGLEETCCHSNSCGRPSANVGMKKLLKI